MIIGAHLIWTAYGWWLPNDPRGSTSQHVASETLAQLGELHSGRKKIQPPGRAIREFYDQAKGILQHPLLELTREDMDCVAESFAATVARERYTCYACAIMRDHAHLLVRKHKHTPQEMMDRLQGDSSLLLREGQRRPANHPVWTQGGAVIYIDHPARMWNTIQYVRGNYDKAHLRAPEFPFVKAYDNWPLHEGHSPKSPYVRTPRGQRYVRPDA